MAATHADGPSAVVLCGIQGSGKTTFYVRRFLHTHVRISLDLLRTRHREAVFLRACLDTRQPFVVDKTNATPEERRRYVEPARAAGFRVEAYWLDATAREAIARNAGRPDGRRIPVAGVLGTRKRLRPPTAEEGFAAVWRVTVGDDGEFRVDPADEPPPIGGR
jgi:predicted kinase